MKKRLSILILTLAMLFLFAVPAMAAIYVPTYWDEHGDYAFAYEIKNNAAEITDFNLK